MTSMTFAGRRDGEGYWTQLDASLLEPTDQCRALAVALSITVNQHGGAVVELDGVEVVVTSVSISPRDVSLSGEKWGPILLSLRPLEWELTLRVLSSMKPYQGGRG